MSEIPAAPEPEGPTISTRGAELAGRGQRLVAVIVDGLLTGIPAGAAGYWLGLYDAALRGEPVTLPDQIAAAVLGAVVFLAINGSLIYGHGQTVGKRLLGVVVVDLDGDEPVEGNRYVFRRLLPMWAAGAVPVVGPIVALVDPLLIFGPERRCLHDYIARTRVIKG